MDTGIEPPGFDTLHPEVDTKAIERFENEFGYALPKDFHAFLLQANGVKFRSTEICFPKRQVWQRQHKRMPAVFPPYSWPPALGEEIPESLLGKIELLKGLSVAPVTTNQEKYVSLQARDNAYGFAKHMPPSLLVIGKTYLNELLCIECGDVRTGEVFVWSSDYESHDEALEGLSLVADSFQQFWEGLVIVE